MSKSAKEMLEVLGWDLVDNEEGEDILYEKMEGIVVYDLYFYIEDKTYEVHGFAKGYPIMRAINASEHLAITQQLKELGWLESQE